MIRHRAFFMMSYTVSWRLDNNDEQLLYSVLYGVHRGW